MGLIKAGIGALGGTLADQWKEFIYCDTLDMNTLVKKGQKRTTGRSSNTRGEENIITDGSRIAVNEGQVMLIVENGKIVDFCAEAGEYIYRFGTEPSMLDSGWKGLKESFKKVGKRFTFGGQAENDQRVYFVNSKEIMNNKIGFGEVPFRDSEFGFTVTLRGYGNYSYRITDPIMFYTNVCANVQDEFRRSQIDEQLKSEVQHNIQPALGRIAQQGIAYDQITLYTNDIAAAINNGLGRDWVEARGISVVSIAFASITPDEESSAKIAQFQESRVYTDANMLGARLGTAQAAAMEKAAENKAGAMTGFMGLGFAQQAGGADPASLFQVGQQQAAARRKKAGEWDCASCGAKGQTSKFCSECGAARPKEASGWKCSECGALNMGKFCSECGAKKPAGELQYKCDKCGWEPDDPTRPPKFCPECGDAFGEEDIVK